MTKRIFMTGLLAMLFGCGDPPAHAPDVRDSVGDPGVEVLEAQVPTTVSVQGSVEASRRSTLSTRMMARVSEVLVEVGDPIRSGEPLVRLGTDDILAKRAMAEAGVASSTAARDEAVRHLARMDTLLAQDAVALVQRDQARLGLTQAESGLLMASALLQEVETAEQYASVRAPFAGRVVSRHIHEGDLSAPGMPLLVVEAEGPRVAVLSVPADLAGKLAVGTSVQVNSPDGEGVEARVHAIASGADPRSRTVEVRAELPSSWSTGVAVTAMIPAGVRDAVTIPQSAVVRRGQLTGVRVATPDGALLRWIRLGRTVVPVGGDDGGPDGGGEAQVEVLSGLVAGERIIR